MMATKYDEWLTTAPDDAEAEWVAERAQTIAEAMHTDHKAIDEALEQAISWGSYAEHVISDLARFFIAYDQAQTNAACAEAGNDLFKALLPHVKTYIASEAHTKAQLEYDNRQTGAKE